MKTEFRQVYLWAALLIAITGTYLHYSYGYSHPDLSGHAWGSDDAYISYRYASNLANGHGLVYNPGERVEGYSNLLYTLIMAAFIKINPSMTYQASFFFNMLCYISTIILFFWYLNQRTKRYLAILGTFALSASPVMWAWPASGLETSSVILVQLALFIASDKIIQKPSGRLFFIFCTLIIISMLLRADGFIFPLLCCVLLFVKGRLRHSVSAAVLVLVLFGIYAAIRYSYYGYILPNTYYAKVSGDVMTRLASAKGLLILLCRIDAFYLYLLPLTVGWYQWFNKIRLKHQWSGEFIPSVPVIALGLLAYWGYVGGDVYFERFLLILIPLSIAHLMIEARQLQSSKAAAALVILLMVILQFKPFIYDQRFDYRLQKYDRWIELGELLGKEYPGATLAVDVAGKVPFFSHLKTIDMLGLNDKYIAHKPKTPEKEGEATRHKYDPDYILSRMPDLIAAWGTNELDLRWGITRDKFGPAGYKLKYVVNKLPDSKAENIIDVASMNEDEIKNLFDSGYKFFVISKLR